MIILKAPAKINLTLKILGKRSDGYHALESVFLKIENLFDVLEFYPSKSDYQTTLECTDSSLPVENNLVLRAANALREKSGIKHGVHIFLNKQIPIEAGLGGGSSDAAVTLLGLNDAWGLGFSSKELMEIGAEIGSDIPFFISEENSAIVTGRGENVLPFNVVNPPKIIVEKKLAGLPTKLIYQQLAFLHPEMAQLDNTSFKDPQIDLTFFMRDALLRGDHKKVGELLTNDLEEAALHFLPEIEEHKREIIERYKGYGSLLSGAGSAVFTIIP